MVERRRDKVNILQNDVQLIIIAGKNAVIASENEMI
jgi:hypothetical protein